MVLLLPLLSAKKTCSRHFSMCYAWHAPRVTNVCDFLTRRDSLLVNRLYSCSLESRPERVREWVLQFHKEQWFIKQCVLIFFRFPESVYATTITSQRKAGSGTWRQSSRFSIVLGSGPLNANVFHVFKSGLSPTLSTASPSCSSIVHFKENYIVLAFRIHN